MQVKSSKSLPCPACTSAALPAQPLRSWPTLHCLACHLLLQAESIRATELEKTLNKLGDGLTNKQKKVSSMAGSNAAGQYQLRPACCCMLLLHPPVCCCCAHATPPLHHLTPAFLSHPLLRR